MLALHLQSIDSKAPIVGCHAKVSSIEVKIVGAVKAHLPKKGRVSNYAHLVESLHRLRLVEVAAY